MNGWATDMAADPEVVPKLAFICVVLAGLLIADVTVEVFRWWMRRQETERQDHTLNRMRKP